jgi:hypothetical protein
MSEKRRALRIQPFVATCRYVHGESRLPGYLTDLSVDGGRVHTDQEPPPVGTSLSIEIRLSRRPTHLTVPARVQWGKPSPRGGHVFGVSFTRLEADAERTLQGVVDEFRRRAASIG